MTLLFSYSLVTGGQVSRVHPGAMGLNPAWRKSMAYTAFGRGWQDGATLAEINAVRRLIMRDMRIVEAIAPESGAYINEVGALHAQGCFSFLLFCFVVRP